MKNFKKLMMISMLSIATQQLIVAADESLDNSAPTGSAPTHQGLGRFGTVFGNALTFHPVDATKALVTGDAPQDSFGWDKEDGHMKSNTARTEHNNNKDKSTAKKKVTPKKRKYDASKKSSKKPVQSAGHDNDTRQSKTDVNA